EAFLANVERNGVARRVQVEAGYSYDVVRRWSAEIDLLFIDADHSYEAVLRDVDDWSPFVRAGGWIALHDVWLEPPPDPSLFYAGPAAVVRERILGDPGWTETS